MPTITRDGITLAYEERGSGSPAFVFVHGGCFSGSPRSGSRLARNRDGRHPMVT
jgi:hypothetical protein